MSRMGDVCLNNHIDKKTKLLILQIDEHGYIKNCSEQLLVLLGYDKFNIIKKHVSEIIDYLNVTNIDATFENIKKMIEDDNNFSTEHRMITIDKKYINVYAQYWYEEDSIEDKKNIYINFIDITQNKKRESKKLNKHILNEKFLDRIETRLSMFNDRGEFIYHNKSMMRFLEEISVTSIDKNSINILGSAIAERINEVSKNSSLKYQFEHCFEVENQTRYFCIRIQGIEKGQGSITINDIHSEKMYQQVVDNASIGIVFEGEEGITYLNDRACEILQVSDKEKVLQTKLVQYIDFEHKLKFLEKFYNPDKMDKFEYCIKKINKKDVVVSIDHETIYLDEEEQRVFMLDDRCVGTETFTDSNIVNENNGNIIETMEYDRLKNEFFANISHELRTPVNVIFSIVQLMEAKHQNIENHNKRYNKILRQNCYRLLRLINNLIEITRIDAGHVRLTLDNYNMVNIVEEITLSVADYIESKGLNLVFDTNTEEIIMACDPEKIECIILNLLANASKFTKPGDYIEVSVEDMKNEWLKIRIKDTGQGIPKSKKDIIFRRFRQVDKSLYREHEGSGIGLSLVKSYIELHGGEIGVESEEGVGSEFTIVLPIRITEKESIKECESYDSGCIIDRINIEFSDIYFNEWEMQSK